jgi:Zn-dependent protease with chaperone function
VRYWVLALVSALSAYALFAVGGSLVARAGAAVLSPGMAGRSPAARARLLFCLRVLPGLASMTAAFGVALPIFLWFEETGTTEPVSRTLGLAAGVGLVLVLRGVWRCAAAWLSTERVLGSWQRRARPLDEFAAPLPAFAIEDAFPIVAVIGVLRPRLFVAERVLRECTPGEIAAMISHECAHVTASDNLKRLCVRACPALFGVAQLERLWSAAAEEAADARAAGSDAGARLDLAGALIRVARLAVPQTPPLASAFYLGGSIDDRVRRLVEPSVEGTEARWMRLAFPGLLAVFVLAVVLAAPTLHAVMEQAVRLLP